MKLSRLNKGFAVAVALLGNSAQAFNADGHEAVGFIADQLLVGTPAGGEVKRLLAGMSLQDVATWADCVKGVSFTGGQYVYKNDDSKYKECKKFGGPDWKSRNEDYAKNNWAQCGTAHGREWCHNQYHYADISTRRDHYADGLVGANDHDVVHAINAALTKLQCGTPGGTFQFADKREALMLLAHFAGDIHQPLHVAAIYLDAQGHTIDPDHEKHGPENDTTGGNAIFFASTSLHFQWDAIPKSIMADSPTAGEEVVRARAVTPTTGSLDTWSTQWATDTISVSKPAFERLIFENNPTNDRQPEWALWGEDATYWADADALKTAQIAKGGARLAQALTQLWPDAAAVKASQKCD
jgi:hypothetical protein